MQWIKDILEKNVNDEGVLDLEAAESELNTEAPKNVIPKEQYNNKVQELSEAQGTLNDLKEKHTDVEELQSSIEEYENKVEQLEQEKADQAKSFALKTALSDVGAVDVDYFADKLKDDVELDEDGNLKDFDDKIKDYQTKHPALFKKPESEESKDDNNGFQIQDNKLDNGTDQPLSMKDIYKQYPNDKEKRIELIQKLDKKDE